MHYVLQALSTRRTALRDIIALTKPRITLMVLLTTACGLWLAPGRIGLANGLWASLGTAVLVSAAGILNCWLEIDVDARMPRTANRPLPAGRLHPNTALLVGLVLGACAVVALCVKVNPLTGLLGALALFLYVGVYTPLKLRTPKALLVGAIPGAMPPLMGWTAVTGQIDPGALSIFGILFFWQLPHFIAISMFRKEEYMRAGVRIVPWVRGEKAAVVHAIAYSLLLWASSMALWGLGTTGAWYGVGAFVLGAVFFGWSLFGLWHRDLAVWSKQLFFYSLLFITLLFPLMALDAA